MIRLIVLLRGINVSGHNKVPMAELRAALDSAGFANVATYIQSGNIALDTEQDPGDVTSRVEELLVEHFDVDVPVVSIAQANVAGVLDAAPFDPDGNQAYQLVYFPGGPVDIEGVETLDRSRFPTDVITATTNAVYVAYDGGQSSSKLTLNALEKAADTSLTGRNVRSTAKLITL